LFWKPFRSIGVSGTELGGSQLASVSKVTSCSPRRTAMLIYFHLE